MLSCRPRSSFEIVRDLRDKDFPLDIVENVVDDLSATGLLDDTDFARDMVLLGQDMHRGWSRIYADLRRRGVDRHLAEESLQSFYDLDKEGVSIRFLVRRNLELCSFPTDKQDLDSMTRKIARRGFSATMVRNIIEELTSKRYNFEASGFLDTNRHLS